MESEFELRFFHTSKYLHENRVFGFCFIHCYILSHLHGTWNIVYAQ